MDSFEKSVLLQASIGRVWKAISDSKEFGSWFGVRFDGPFQAGKDLTGEIVPTTVDPEVAKAQAPYAGFKFEIYVEKIEPERLFSFRWHPYAVEPERDYSQEPTTLVEFFLEQKADGVMLTIRESGFDALPNDRKAKALEMNEGGWDGQCKLISKYLVG